MVCRKSLTSLALSLSLCFPLLNAEGAGTPKKRASVPKGVLISASDVFETQIRIKNGKKTQTRTIQCLNTTGGDLTTTKKGLLFTSFAVSLKKLNLDKRKNAARIKLYKLYQSASRSACVKPDYLSLEKYTGPFGEAEARLIYNRFAFGARPTTVSAAAANGLAATVNSLLTYTPEPALEEVVKDLNCDGKLAGDPNNPLCDPNDPNDIYFPGVRYGLYYRFLNSVNPAFERLFFWLHDERLSASTDALSWCTANGLLPHVAMLRRAAISGDYVQYMKEWNNDLMGNLEWLDGASNRGESPNENYAREFWELGTVGPSDLNGNAVYSDIDVAQSALGFSGWGIQGYNINDNWVCLPTYIPNFHAQGPKSIFNGTPYQTVVYNSDDILRATFIHPRTAESLAEDLWKEFINPYATPASIRELAKIIRESNYNLVAVLRRIMTSRAVFASKSRKSLIKHPLDQVIGFLKLSGIPVSLNQIDNMLNEMGQRPLLPNTIFGWDQRKLAGEAYVLNWRNSLLSLTTQGTDSLKQKGYDMWGTLVAGLPGQRAASLEMIERMARWLEVSLNDAQIARLDQYMNYNLARCYNPSQCGGNQYRLDRKLFDSAPDSDFETKTRGLLTILSMMPDYRMK